MGLLNLCQLEHTFDGLARPSSRFIWHSDLMDHVSQRVSDLLQGYGFHVLANSILLHRKKRLVRVLLPHPMKNTRLRRNQKLVCTRLPCPTNHALCRSNMNHWHDKVALLSKIEKLCNTAALWVD